MENLKKSKLISEGLFLVGLTAVCYLIAYIFERGYAAYFDIPYEIITITLEQMLGACLAILIFCSSVFLILHIFVLFFGDFLKKPDSLWKRIALFHLGAIIIVPIIYFSFGTLKWGLLIAAIAIFLVDFAILMPTLVSRLTEKSEMPLKDRIEHIINNDPKTDVFGLIEQAFGRRINIIILVLILAIALSYAAGNYTAHNKPFFWVDESNNLVLLTKYGNMFIFKEFDPKKNILLNNVRILDSSQISKHPLQKKKLGRIKAPED